MLGGRRQWRWVTRRSGGERFARLEEVEIPSWEDGNCHRGCKGVIDMWGEGKGTRELNLCLAAPAAARAPGK